MTDITSGLELRSLIKSSGELEISLQQVAIPAPGPDEVVVRIEAAPINPSDLGLLLGARRSGECENFRLWRVLGGYRDRPAGQYESDGRPSRRVDGGRQ